MRDSQGHSVPVPGLGTMRFSVNAKSVSDVNMVASSLITTRKIIFTPSVDVKKALKEAAISITCYDRDGNVVKRVNSGDSGEIEHLLQVPGRGAAADLYDQCHRGLQPAAPQGDEGKIRLSDR